MKRATVIFSNFGPYHLARLDAASQAGKPENLLVTGIELARSEADYQWQVELENLSFPILTATQGQLERTRFDHLLSRLFQLLRSSQPDVVFIAGYSRPAMLAVLGWCLSHRIPAVVMSESTKDDIPRLKWREAFKRYIVNHFQAALVGGKLHKQYIVELGIKPEAVFTGYDVVDNDCFSPTRLAYLPPPHPKPYFLSINRFVPKKNLSTLISAFARYRQQFPQGWDLILCGDGELRSQLEQQISRLNLEKAVYLPGFLQQADLLPYFAHASCFIHASQSEQWGLVVNEAMAAGLPVLLSNRCGCYPDLLIEGVNGFGFDPADEATLTDLMGKMSSETLDLAMMGRAALQHIQKYSPQTFGSAVVSAINYVLS